MLTHPCEPITPGLKSRWELERAGVTRLQDLKNQIDNLQTQIAKAEREYDLNTAAVLKYGTMPELQKQLKEEEDLYAKNEGQTDKTANRMIRDTVGRYGRHVNTFVLARNYNPIVTTCTLFLHPPLSYTPPPLSHIQPFRTYNLFAHTILSYMHPFYNPFIPHPFHA